MALSGLILAPHLFGLLSSDRWPATVLVAITVGLIGNKHAPTEIIKPHAQYVAVTLSGGLIVFGYLVGIDKLMFAAGLGLFWAGLTSENPTLVFPYRLLAALILVIPLPANIETLLAIWLSNIESELFVSIGQSVGFDVYKLGTQVIANNVAVSINSDCSGSLLIVPSILGMLTASALSGKQGTRFWGLMVIALPLAFGINFLRLTILVYANFATSSETAALLHDILGWLFMPLAWLLPVILFGKTPSISNYIEKSLPLKPISACAAAIALTVPFHISSQNNSLIVPYYVGQWIGVDQSVSEAETSLLGTEQIVRRLYTNTFTSEEVLATIILHDSVSKGLEHTSANCFRAMGWAVDKLSTEKLPNNRTLTKMRVTDHKRSQLVTELTGTVATNSSRDPAHVRVQVVTHKSLTPQATNALVSLLENSIQLDARNS